MRMRFITFFKECSPRSSSTKSSGILATDRRSSPWAPLARHILSPEAGTLAYFLCRALAASAKAALVAARQR